MTRSLTALLGALALLAPLGCSGSGGSDNGKVQVATAESCMTCHNGSSHDDYAGRGLENPHPFTGAATLSCTTCHGGNPLAPTAGGAHVPPPPEIGDERFQEQNQQAYFNRLTLTGIDKFPDYVANGRTYRALDYLQFVNPGDLRVVTKGRSCGQCHAAHAESVARSPLATETGILSGAMYAIGVESSVPGSRGRYQDTVSDLSFRAVSEPGYVYDENEVGAAARLFEFPVYSVNGDVGPRAIHRNPLYNSRDLPRDQLPDGRVATDSPLADLYHEQVAFTCGDCHLGSAGANDRYGDFRSSGCTACHMPYALDGRSHSTDPNIRKFEPLDPDDIDPPERAHVRSHRIVSVAQTLATGETVQGMDDYTCAGCHQGSNRTVMQFWGIRLDQNQDVRRGQQYPANPASFQTTRDDTRLFDPEVNNRTFNGRNENQYLLFEDYDNDGRDDTPEDVHYEAGMGCIDCHGSHDLHGGTVGDETTAAIHSRQEQAVAIRCESCHGSGDAYAATVPGVTYSGDPADVAVDSEGNPLRHVVREAGGDYYLTSRLTGRRHYISQTRDVVVDSGKLHPFRRDPIYTDKGSYAMGRADGDSATGLGPIQSGPFTHDFSHMDNMSCASCHASWTNNCIGCHLSGEYDTGNNFSNITGQRIVFEQDDADFVYQSPVFFQLGIDTKGKVAPIAGNTDVFWHYRDLNGEFSKIFAFSDRNGQGGDRSSGDHPALSHNVLMPHSIRGRVRQTKEGPRYCVACHLTNTGLAAHRTEYDTFRSAMSNKQYGGLPFDLLKSHIGQNPGNQLNSPFWVHMAAGLGSGLFLFDEHGCAVNPLDTNANRIGCNGIAPADNFDPLRAALNLDRIVDSTGFSLSSNTHPLLDPTLGPTLRDGAAYPMLSGPLGALLIQKLADPDNGIVLDSWIDANGQPRGDASTHMDQ